MPYIDPHERAMLEDRIDDLQAVILSPGTLNYVVTRLVHDWVLNSTSGLPTYSTYNAAIGVLECAKLEMYRRVVSPYEDNKMRTNGDVY